ncbi:hypothetical protein X781_12610 [Mannheimia sp. USDA-ARS-USMARC-1261]|nr:hypothetical protein X781_12610 [Mannheimia sp. USDA-ARS-USMARC-1261]
MQAVKKGENFTFSPFYFGLLEKCIVNKIVAKNRIVYLELFNFSLRVEFISIYKILSKNNRLYFLSFLSTMIQFSQSFQPNEQQ